MAAWVIQEVMRVGANAIATPDGGERFEWTTDDLAPNAAKGGARAAPHVGWSIGVKQNTKRTKYAGGQRVSEQIFGGEYADQKLTGTFDDRYNFPGYAEGEMRRLEAMILRGNLVRVQFGAHSFEGVITDCEFPVRGEWEISYALTVSIHDRTDAPTILKKVGQFASGQARVLQAAMAPAQAFDRVDLATQTLLDVHQDAPRGAATGDLLDTLDAVLGRLAGARDAVAQSLDARELAPTVQPIDQFRRLGTQLRALRALSSDLVVEVAGLRSDLTLAVQTPLGVLDFEIWSRSIRYNARLTMGTSFEAAQNIEERSDAPAARLHRCQSGESLYAISRRYYGTPHAWRMIADRNDLQSFTMTGVELLIIPERGSL